MWRAKGTKPETEDCWLVDLRSSHFGCFGDQETSRQYRGDEIPKGKPGNLGWHLTDLPIPRRPRSTVKRQWTKTRREVQLPDGMSR